MHAESPWGCQYCNLQPHRQRQVHMSCETLPCARIAAVCLGTASPASTVQAASLQPMPKPRALQVRTPGCHRRLLGCCLTHLLLRCSPAQTHNFPADLLLAT